MADSRDPLQVTLEVVVVALAPHFSSNVSGNGSTTPFSLEPSGNRAPYEQHQDSGALLGTVDDASIRLKGDYSPAVNGVREGFGDDAGTAATADRATMVSLNYIALFSTLFCVVGVIGMAGNALVVWIVLTDRKMRKSVTNLLILNLAVADSLLMVFGVPEIVQFMLDRGWLLGAVACKVNRSVLVAALYASVLTLVAVCIERYIAIVFPIKAHILCTRRRVILVIVCVWLLAIFCSLPTALFNDLVSPAQGMPHYMCIQRFSHDRVIHFKYLLVFKFTEFSLFYFGPLILQMVCYIVIGRRLFVGVDKLHRNVHIRCTPDRRQRTNEAIKARKGVVKMLIASVIIYFLSYSPHQILLFFNTFSHMPFAAGWMFLVLTTTLAYINSAANPLLYCVFSENFRTKFKAILQCCTCQSCCCSSCCRKTYVPQRSISLTSLTEYTTLFHKSPSSNKKTATKPALL